MLSQKEAVFSAVTKVFSDSGRTFGAGTPADLSKEERAAVTEIVTAGITSGEVVFSDAAKAKYDTPEKIRNYVNGMVGNWLTKDTRLNGGEKYSPANPGSRAGQGDEIMKNLRGLLKNVQGNAEQEAAVLAEIEKRKTELAASKIKPISINRDALPESLRHLAAE
jgi:hypothetical protein